MKTCALRRISIGLITFPFYCVKGEMMKVADENSRGAHTGMIKFGFRDSGGARWVCIFYTLCIQEEITGV